MRILLVGQAPPKTDPSMPFARSKLYGWLRSIGIEHFKLIDQRDGWNGWYEGDGLEFAFSAIVNFFPGSTKRGHLAPTPTQILECRDFLKKEIDDFKPDVVIPIGKQSIQEALIALGKQSLSLSDTIGRVFHLDAYALVGHKLPVIPLPHPSGASSWVYMDENKKSLAKALELIKREITLV